MARFLLAGIAVAAAFSALFFFAAGGFEIVVVVLAGVFVAAFLTALAPRNQSSGPYDDLDDVDLH